eukprot:TRINITY_DN766_c0_g1_i1.p1 TRINITY_DN766_c0_g1~~TRINITY_DN766_c0_g1_i1.p1  ORF type:complete len:321 (-),score=145.54 TRINITY_DN766_c0_g1_i1:279-1241(-)
MAPLEAEKGEEPKPEIVLKLEELDNKYLELHKQYEKEVAALAKKFTEKQQPFLDKRTEALCKGEDSKTGTPACADFWLQAMKNHPSAKDYIEKHDEAVLSFLKNIQKDDVDKEDPEKGYCLTFEFASNPYFDHKELKMEIHYGETNPYNGEVDIEKIKSTDIEWKDGMDVTVEKTVKKVKGGGAKKNKQKGKETVEPRESIFRMLFVTASKDDEEPPESLAMFLDDEEDPEDAVEMMMHTIDEIACGLKDSLIPFAVRWYTGEAKTDDDDDDDEDDESEDDDDDDDDESEEEAPRGKKGGKKGGSRKGSDDAKKEECKQQ